MKYELLDHGEKLDLSDCLNPKGKYPPGLKKTSGSYSIGKEACGDHRDAPGDYYIGHEDVEVKHGSKWYKATIISGPETNGCYRVGYATSKTCRYGNMSVPASNIKRPRYLKHFSGLRAPVSAWGAIRGFQRSA